MGLQNWSTTPANNANAAPNVNMATGSAPSTVHPSVRQMMADVANWYAAPEWVLQADTPTYTGATTFTVPTNRTATYSVNRRVQATGTGYTINGTITASAYGTVTTVTVAWDSGSLDNTVSQVAVGILQSQLASLQAAAASQLLTVQSGSVHYATDSGTANALAVTLSPAPSAQIAGMTVRVGNVKANNTGATTLNVNGLGALPIYGMGNAPLQGGELPAGADCVVVLDHAAAHWILVGVFGGALPVGTATQGNHAVNLSQLNANLGHATTGVYGIVILGTSSNINSGTAGVIPDAAAVNGATVGYGTQRDVTASRAFGTNYTNTYGRPIWVHIQAIVSSGTVPLSAVTGGNTYYGSASTGTNISAVDILVRPGDTYSCAGTGMSSLSKWFELG